MMRSPASRGWLAIVTPVVLAIVLVTSPTAGAPTLVLPIPPGEEIFLAHPVARPTPVVATPYPAELPRDLLDATRPTSWLPPASRSLGAIGDAPVLGASSTQTPIAQPDPTAVVVKGDGRFAVADTLLADREFDRSQALLQQIAASPNHADAAHAQFLLGRALLVQGASARAVAAFQDYLAHDADGADAAAASLALAEQIRQAGHPGDALALYQAYLDRTADHALDGYALLGLAAGREAGGDAMAAIDLDRRAVLAGLPPSDELPAATKVGARLGATQGPAASAAWYAQLADRPGLAPATRAHYQVLAADDSRRSGQTDAAVTLYRHVVADAATAADTLSAVVALGAMNQHLSLLAVGDAFLKSGRYADAVAAYGDFVDANPTSPDVASARIGRGQALFAAGELGGAAAQLQKFLANHPNDPRASDASMLLGKALYAAGDTNGAVAALRTFAQGHPADPKAATGLWRAIQYLRDDGRSGETQPLQDAILANFPTSAYAPQIVFQRGWDAYEHRDFATARRLWENVRAQWPASPGSDAALLWLGKLDQRAGDPASARSNFTLSWQANPGDFYALRGRELATGTSPVGNVAATVDASPAELQHERAMMVSWLAGWTHPSPADADRPYLNASIAQTTTLIRVRSLVALGLIDRAQHEVKLATDLYADDPRSLYALADVLAQAGLTRESMAVAYDLLMMSPAPNAFQSPTYLQRMVYPFPYRDLIESAARAHHVDPLLLVALIKQESGFDPMAHSPADAVGLTQIMPATATTLAASAGLTGFSPDDLRQPRVAIELGAAYLGGLTRELDGNPYLAIVAYNAGSGALHQWLADNPRHDVDLLAQEIPFQETRDYVRNVYRFYQEYQTVYRPSATTTGSGG